MKIGILILLALLLISCGPINTIPTEVQELTINLNEEDTKSFLNFYSTNKVKFWDIMLSNDQFSMDKLRDLMLAKGMNKMTLNDFMPILNSYSQIHKERTIASDIIYKTGFQCLNEIVKLKLIEFEKEVKTLAQNIQPLISKSDWNKLSDIHNSQMKLIDRRQENFKEIESMTNGEIGKNITAYNQLCFQIIRRVYCTEYGRKNKENTYELTDEIFNRSKKLNSYFEKYSVLEEQLVSLIESDKCKKRIGILRYYDGLSKTNIVKTQKANMLMNVSKLVEVE